MRGLIVAAALAAAFIGGSAMAANRDPNSAVLICKDVQIASTIHKVSVEDVSASMNMASNAMDDNRCFPYSGASRWKLLEENRTYGYGKVKYDLDTKKPKIGYVPWFDIYALGLSSM